MDQSGSVSPLRDTLLALPRWAAHTAVGLLVLGVIAGLDISGGAFD